MLDTVFPRIRGDIGNENTFDFPVRYEVVREATPKRVVREADRELIKPFIEAARKLEREGAGLITTSCGFLALFQSAVAGAVGVPFISSSLLQIPLVHRLYGADKKVGVLTADARHLTPEHFQAAGAGNIPLVIHGLEDRPEFSRVFLGNSRDADFKRLEKEVGEVASLFAGFGDIGAVVLECTNLSPFAALIGRKSGLPVFHLNSLINMIYLNVKRGGMASEC